MIAVEGLIRNTQPGKLMPTVTNTIRQWHDAARIMGIRDAEGGFNAFSAALTTSKWPGVTAVVVRSDGSKVTYREGRKISE
jgi:hypothetical protein